MTASGDLETSNGTRQLKVLMVVTRADSIGGAQVHVRDLGVCLKADGWRVWVAAGPGEVFEAELQRNGLEFVPIKSMRNSVNIIRAMEAVIELAGIIRRLSPDIVCAHSTVAGFVTRTAAKLVGVPCVFTAHSWAFSEGNPPFKVWCARIAEKVYANLSTKIICASEYDRQLAINAGMKAEKLVTVRCGLRDISADMHSSPDQVVEVPKILMVARFSFQKDHETLLRAAAHVPNARFILVGGGPLMDDSKRLASELGVADRVEFWGERWDVEAIYRDVQIFALATRYEAVSLVLSEAMRAGLPCVCSDVGGCGEALLDGVTGYLVPRGDWVRFAERLNQLVNDPALRQTMGRAGRERYANDFTLQRMGSETIQVYKSILSQSSTVSG